MSQREPSPEITPRKIVTFLAFALVLTAGLAAAWDSWYVTDNGERVVTFDRMSGSVQTHDQGFHFKLPILETKTRYNVREQLYTTPASAASSDLQDAHTTIAVRYAPDVESVAQLHQDVGPDYVGVLIAPAVQQILKNATSHFSAEQLVTERPAVQQEVERALADRLAPSHVIVTAVDLTDFQFSPEFTASIEAKVTAQQRALEEANRLDQVRYQAQQVEVNASAQANATVTLAQAQADAARIVGEQLHQDPNYLEFVKIQKWNGQLPTVTGGQSPVSLLVNVPTTTTG
ncbi:MAG: hypothetical protein QOE90_1500 [Thermoplasmata archaeon]|jgi:regulator of protease activity HflC (stomatin/prohibitin superfamily)|nr:hypothetical protein [Thermoplasmata archaeon]